MQRHLLVAASCSVFLLGSPANAQPKQSAGTSNQANTRIRRNEGLSPAPASLNMSKAGESTEIIKYDHLRKPPSELPALPNFEPPSSKFTYGLKNSSNGSTSLQLYFESAADSQSIMRHYTDQFQQPGWKVLTNRGGYLSATYRNNVCSVRTQTGQGKNSQTNVQLNYEFRKDQ
jgi:hypothetical protein